MVFPGQGAQSVGMLDALAAEFPQVRKRCEVASEVLGYDLWTTVAIGPADVLNQTRVTQPALLTASVAIWDVWCARGGPPPAWMAGHSFGEYSALVCAGALDFADAIALVAARGRCMQEAVAEGEGAMAAVLGIDAPALDALCREAAQGEVVSCANLNAPGQVVISGTASAVARAGELARTQGAKRVIPLVVSVPAHCALMTAAATAFAPCIESVAIVTPAIPVLHNIDVRTHAEPSEIRAALIAQLVQPVRWQETIERLMLEGVARTCECGPGKVLSPLIRRCAPAVTTLSLGSPTELREALDALAKEQV
jgi:[acyl-carrier-protein] S-malonyltransferase